MIEIKDFQIYMAGAMSGLSWEKQIKWRRDLRNAILYDGYAYDKKVHFFNPTQYYNFQEKHYKNEKEIMEFNLYNLRKSDLIVVNFNNPNSIGAAMEVMLAYELHIPILALNANKVAIHPWLETCCNRICDNMEELIEHIVSYFLTE